MYTPLAGARQIEFVLTAVPGVIIVRVATVSGTLLWVGWSRAEPDAFAAVCRFGTVTATKIMLSMSFGTMH